MKKFGKITVNHFLNKRLKPIENDRYPLYIQIIVGGKKTQVRSEILIRYDRKSSGIITVEQDNIGYLSDSELKNLIVQENKVAQLIRLEKMGLTAFFLFLQLKMNEKVNVSNFKEAYDHLMNDFGDDFIYSGISQLESEVQYHKRFSELSNLLFLNHPKELMDSFTYLSKESNHSIEGIEFILSRMKIIYEIYDLIKDENSGFNGFLFETFFNDKVELIKNQITKKYGEEHKRHFDNYLKDLYDSFMDMVK